MARWLMKTDPDTYRLDDLVRDKKTNWNGVRNNAARLHLMAMKKGDAALLYHSGDDKAVVATMEIVREHYLDPEPDDDRWVQVDVKLTRVLPRPLTLKEIKAHPVLKGMELVRQSRLSVSPVSDEQWDALLKLASG